MNMHKDEILETDDAFKAICCQKNKQAKITILERPCLGPRGRKGAGGAGRAVRWTGSSRVLLGSQTRARGAG